MTLREPMLDPGSGDGLPAARSGERATMDWASLRRDRGPASLAVNEVKIAGVDEQSQRLAGDEHRVPAVERVNEQQGAAADREQPEAQRDDAAPRALRRDPLHQKPRREQRLRQEPERNPPVELQDEDVAEIISHALPKLSHRASPPRSAERGRGGGRATTLRRDRGGRPTAGCPCR